MKCKLPKFFLLNLLGFIVAGVSFGLCQEVTKNSFKDSTYTGTELTEVSSKRYMKLSRSTYNSKLTTANRNQEVARLHIGELKTQLAKLRYSRDSLENNLENSWFILLGQLGQTPAHFNQFLEDIDLQKRTIMSFKTTYQKNWQDWENALQESKNKLSQLKNNSLCTLQTTQYALELAENALAQSKMQLSHLKNGLNPKTTLQNDFVSSSSPLPSGEGTNTLATPPHQSSPSTTAYKSPGSQKPKSISPLSNLKPQTQTQVANSLSPQQVINSLSPQGVINSPSSTPSSNKKIRVNEGESLWILAERYYGDKNRWADIYWANKEILPTPESLEPGMLLIVPP